MIKHKRRFVIFLSISVVCYVAAMILLFNQFRVFPSIIAILIFFVSFHFLYLDIYSQPQKYFIWTMVILTIIGAIALGHQNLGLITGIVCINLAIYFLGNSLHSETQRTNKFSGLSYFRVGGYLFTMSLTAGYSFTSLGLYNKFPFDCAQLSAASNSVIDTLTSPLKLGRDEANKLKGSTSSFFQTTFKDAVILGENLELESKNPQSTNMIDKLKERKENLITQTIKENKELNMGICDYTLGIINKKLASPGVQVTVIIFMVFLIYPFLRMIIQAMSIIAYLIFQICYKVGIYHTETITKEVEVIG